MTDSSVDSSVRRPFYRRIGPGLITACVVIGPGSVITSTTVGAEFGTSLLWVVLFAAGCMTAYMTLAARIGTGSAQTPAEQLAGIGLRPLAVAIGIAVFIVAATFQFANNLGAEAAVRLIAERTGSSSTWIESFSGRAVMIFAFNAAALVFAFGFRSFYAALERLMTALVGIMLVAFALGLLLNPPSLSAVAAGLIPGGSAEPGTAAGLTGAVSRLADYRVLGLIATTFAIAAAYYQAYLVRQKGWTPADLKDGLLDARVTTAVMAAITLMIMLTGAVALHGKTVTRDVQAIGSALEPAFGRTGVILFAVGLFCAAWSSFLVNSMIGGFLLADGFGLGNRQDAPVPRAMMVAVLVLGALVAVFVQPDSGSLSTAIVIAQALTVPAFPLLAGTLLFLANRRTVPPEARPHMLTNVVAVIGLLIVCVSAGQTLVQKVIPKLSEQPVSTVTENPDAGEPELDPTLKPSQ